MVRNKVFSTGNSKLPKKTAIFNLGSATHCPSAKLGLCQLSDPSKCYALKAERMYPNVLPYRERQSQFWQYATANDFVARLNLETGSKYDKVRLNESGDIGSIRDIRKIADIAQLIPDIVIYFYTARKDMWDLGLFDDLPENVVICGSGFMAHNEFRAVPKDHDNDKALYCVEDCKICDLCSIKGNETILARMH